MSGGESSQCVCAGHELRSCGRGAKHSVVVPMRNVPYRCIYLNTCFSVGSTVWGNYGTFRGWSLAGGRKSLEEGFTSFLPICLPISCSSSLCFLCVDENVTSVLPASYGVPCLPTTWTPDLKLQAEITPPEVPFVHDASSQPQSVTNTLFSC